MYHLKVIKNELEHEQAMSRLLALMESNPKENTPEGDELELLAFLIEQFELENFPMDKPDPIEAIKFRMDQMQLKNKDLVPYIGSQSKVSEVLNRKRPLSLNMIRQLSDGLGISADVLIQQPEQKQVNDLDVDWEAFPIAKMRSAGYFPDVVGSVAELKSYAAEHIGKFLTEVGALSFKPALLKTTAHLRSNEKEIDSYALWAWQAQVLHLAKAEPLAIAYKPGSVTLEWMKQLARLSLFDQGPLLAREFLNKSGIHMVIEPHLPKTYLDGAVCFGLDGNPVVAMTLRYDKLDNFWFTLMHELAHIALHLGVNQPWYLDNLDAESSEDIESEADALARDGLIPEVIWQEAKVETAEDVKQLARSLAISPCIVAGRVRFERGDHKMFGPLFREKFRHLFDVEVVSK